MKPNYFGALKVTHDSTVRRTKRAEFCKKLYMCDDGMYISNDDSLAEIAWQWDGEDALAWVTIPWCVYSC